MTVTEQVSTRNRGQTEDGWIQDTVAATGTVSCGHKRLHGYRRGGSAPEWGRRHGGDRKTETQRHWDRSNGGNTEPGCGCGWFNVVARFVSHHDCCHLAPLVFSWLHSLRPLPRVITPQMLLLLASREQCCVLRLSPPRSNPITR